MGGGGGGGGGSLCEVALPALCLCSIPITDHDLFDDFTRRHMAPVCILTNTNKSGPIVARNPHFFFVFSAIV